MKFVYDVREGNIGQREPVFYNFRTFGDKPFIGGNPKIALELPSEIVQTVAAQFRQFFRVVGFAVVRHHEASEWYALVCYGVEEQPEFFGGVIAGEKPYQFLVLQSPQGRLVGCVVDVTVYAVHQMRQLPAGGQFAEEIGFPGLRLYVPVGVEIGKHAVFYAAHRIVEVVHQQRCLALCHPVIVTATRYK